jgi:hypothetical protein
MHVGFARGKHSRICSRDGTIARAEPDNTQKKIYIIKDVIVEVFESTDHFICK